MRTFIRYCWPYHDLASVFKTAVLATHQDTNTCFLKDKFVVVVGVFHGPARGMRLSSADRKTVTTFSISIYPLLKFIKMVLLIEMKGLV